MFKKKFQTWDRLAHAAIQARDDLRGVLPKLERAIADSERGPEAQAILLSQVRDIARRNADGLRLALKHSKGRPARQDARSRAAEPLWGVAEGEDALGMSVRRDGPESNPRLSRFHSTVLTKPNQKRS